MRYDLVCLVVVGLALVPYGVREWRYWRGR